MTQRASIATLAGLYPPVPTPFAADGQVDYDNLHDNLVRLNREPLQGYVLGGSNGEYVTLTPAERVEMVRAARRAVGPNRLLIAGAGMESTAGTIELTRQMAEAGADAVLVVTPNYYKRRMTGAALEKYFTEVASAAPVPVILYNVPANTGIDLPAPNILNLAGHPNIIGLKESGGDVTKIGYIVHKAPPRFQVLAGSAGFLLPALSVGAVGAISALANIAAQRLYDMMEAFKRGDVLVARGLQLPLIALNSALTVRFGVPGLKAAMDLLGYYGGPVRPPLEPATEAEVDIIKSMLKTAHLLDG